MKLSLLFLMASTAAATAAPFDVTDAWFRSLPGGVPAGGYFTAQNNSGREVAITGVQSSACGIRKDDRERVGRQAVDHPKNESGAERREHAEGKPLA